MPVCIQYAYRAGRVRTKHQAYRQGGWSLPALLVLLLSRCRVSKFYDYASTPFGYLLMIIFETYPTLLPLYVRKQFLIFSSAFLLAPQISIRWLLDLCVYLE